MDCEMWLQKKTRHFVVTFEHPENPIENVGELEGCFNNIELCANAVPFLILICRCDLTQLMDCKVVISACLNSHPIPFLIL